MSEESNVPIYIVDDDQLVRDSLRDILEDYKFTVIDFDSGERFLNALESKKTPGCLILDSQMPGISGQEVHEKLNKLGAIFNIIFLTGHGDLQMAVKAFRGGANDYFQKPISTPELIASIKKAQKGSLLRFDKYRRELQFNRLNAREKELFYLVVDGLINKQIADKLCISIRTVEVHRAKMMAGLNASNITDLVKIFDILKNDS